jgi:uncharacterized membrane protein
MTETLPPSASPRAEAPEPLPFVAPCRDLPASAPLGWISRGWSDFRRAPGASLAYGALIVLLSWFVTGIGLAWGSYWSALVLLSGFVFIAPLLALGLYGVSRHLNEGASSAPPSLAGSLGAVRRPFGTVMVFAVALLVLFLIWARSASMVHVFFPAQGTTGLAEMALFLGVGSAVGAVFCLLTFVFSAFSLPMICDRDADAVTAVVTSVNAVLRNKPAMAVWAGLIVLLTMIGFATALIGLAVVIPVLGYATWHGYRETIDASAWPKHADSP